MVLYKPTEGCYKSIVVRMAADNESAKSFEMIKEEEKTGVRQAAALLAQQQAVNVFCYIAPTKPIVYSQYVYTANKEDREHTTQAANQAYNPRIDERGMI